MSDLKKVVMWTDGACVGNPGPGGYAAVLRCGEHRREVSGGVRHTTNNRMELLAVIAGLRALKYPCAVTVHSDARYVVDGVMTPSARRWQAKGWVQGGRLVPNADLWQQLLAECARHEVTLCWIKGHAGDPDNERCDELSERAARAPGLPPDEGYEGRDALALALGCAAGQRTLFEPS
jgi:ribonuclease HI